MLFRSIELSDIFAETTFRPFRGQCVRGITVPDCVRQPRSFFENMLKFAESIGMKGLGYIEVLDDGTYKGPIDKYLTEEQRAELVRRGKLDKGSVIFFIADDKAIAPQLAGQIRTELGRRLNLIDESRFELCFIVDFPMFAIDEETGKYIFMHNPFSMPQGGMDALLNQAPALFLHLIPLQ